MLEGGKEKGERRGKGNSHRGRARGKQEKRRKKKPEIILTLPVMVSPEGRGY